MKLFVESPVCTSKVHCGTCRDRVKGLKFRVDHAKFFLMPTDAPDFECPFGNLWGYRPEPRGAGDVAVKIFDKLGIRSCETCIERAIRLNRIVPFSDNK